jgi:hypothetical protein
MYFPNWDVLSGFNTSIQKSSFTVITPKDYQFRFKEFNMPVEVVKSSADDCDVYSWQIENLRAYKQEPLSPPIHIWAPTVKTSPSSFEIDGYTGSFDSWQAMGEFFTKLNSGKDNIPDETVDHVRNLLDDSMTDYEKISRIHKFSQNKNRYISIQDGLGGIEPFDAETVDRLSYGDCKALTNYTMTLLNKLGYKSYYTLVNASYTSYVDHSFPMDYYNHVFLCVPTESDTLWVECTNAHSPCGYIGDFTDDRYVLVINGDKSKLVKTPSYTADQNRVTTKGNVILDNAGDAKARYSMHYTGAQFSSQFGLTLLDEKDKKKRITNSIDVPNFQLDSYSLKANMQKNPTIDVGIIYIQLYR